MYTRRPTASPHPTPSVSGRPDRRYRRDRDRVVLSPGTLVTDGQIKVLATIPPTNSGGPVHALAVDADGSRAYRAEYEKLEVLDLTTIGVTGTWRCLTTSRRRRATSR